MSVRSLKVSYSLNPTDQGDDKPRGSEVLLLAENAVPFKTPSSAGLSCRTDNPSLFLHGYVANLDVPSCLIHAR